MDSHRFGVGETVRFLQVTRIGTPKSPHGPFRVIGLLPAYQGSRQYRLESSSDGHQRVAVEFELAEQ
ncbi:MAG: hypothetical protein RIM84_26975 [Alphaproteobacteria bacterium]